MLFASIKATSQKIDTSFKSCVAAKINNLIINRNFPVDADTATHLGIINATNNFKGKCDITYVLLNNKENVIISSYTLTNEEYNEWNNGNVVKLMQILSSYLKITFKD